MTDIPREVLFTGVKCQYLWQEMFFRIWNKLHNVTATTVSMTATLHSEMYRFNSVLNVTLQISVTYDGIIQFMILKKRKTVPRTRDLTRGTQVESCTRVISFYCQCISACIYNLILTPKIQIFSSERGPCQTTLPKPHSP